MKTYTEEDLRYAYIQGAKDYCESPKGIDTFLNEDVEDYISSLNEPIVKEREIPFTYFSLRQKLDWEEFCDLTGTNIYAKKEGYEIRDNETFYIVESKAKQFNLI